MTTNTATALLRYLITGGTAAVVDVSGFAALSLTRVPVVLAAACSFGAATVVNYLSTSRWVFRAAPTRQKYLLFLMGAVLGLPVNVGLTYVAVTYLALPPMPAKALAIAMTFLLNFWINARVVFR